MNAWRLICPLVVAPALAAGQTITVTGGDDAVDFRGAQRAEDLPGPDGIVTFFEAVTAANNTPGPQTIVFTIPRERWWTVLYSDRCVIRHELMAYLSGDDTTVDFTTQTAFTGDTNPAGNEVAFYYAGAPASIPNLWLAGNRITVRGVDRLLGNNFEQGLWITGNECKVVGCTTTGFTINGSYGNGRGNIIGGAATGDGNTFTGATNILSHASGNVVIGNTFRWGLRISGDTFYGTCDDNIIGGRAAGERNIFAGRGTVGEEGLPTGTELEVMHALRTRIEGNLVGTSDDGLARFAGRTGAAGIVVGLGAVGTTVRSNTVAGIERTGSNHYQGQRFGTAIAVNASALGTVVQDNRIGVAIDGTTPVRNVAGVTVLSDPNGTPSATRIAGNIIAHNETTGVRVLNTATGVTITANSIFENGGIGIDLGGNGVTPNDARDADTGPNNVQNFPVLAAATSAGGRIRIEGTLPSAANLAYTIEFFAGPSCDPQGYGEGPRFLGTVAAATDASGLAPFVAELAAGVPENWVVTATATQDATGNTSEFSGCLAVHAGCAADMNGDGFVDFFDYQSYVDAFESGEPRADFDGDGFVDFFDYGGFVGAFETGC